MQCKYTIIMSYTAQSYLILIVYLHDSLKTNCNKILSALLELWLINRNDASKFCLSKESVLQCQFSGVFAKFFRLQFLQDAFVQLIIRNNAMREKCAEHGTFFKLADIKHR